MLGGGAINFNRIISGISPNTGNINTSTKIQLDTNASSVDGAYDPGEVRIVEGTGSGQSRQIWEYDGATRCAFVNRDWKITPDNTSRYEILFYAGDTHVNEGVAQGGGASTITLNTLASSQNNVYLGQIIFIVAGTGADQARMVVGYNGTTKVVTVDAAWIIQPDNTSIYAMLPYPGFVHGNPSQNSAANVLIRDVIGNKTDNEAGNSLYSKNYIQCDHIHNEVFLRPYLAGSEQLQKASGAWAAFPTPTQIIAAGDISDTFDLHFMNVSAISANGEYAIALYKGAALSEELIGVFGAVRNAIQSQEGSRPIITPLLPANTRVSAALSSENAAQDTLNLKVEGHTY
jgi:hypothetical protein